MIIYRYAIRTISTSFPGIARDRIRKCLESHGASDIVATHAVADNFALNVAFRVPDNHDDGHEEMCHRLGRLDGVTTCHLYGMKADLSIIPFLAAIRGNVNE